MEMFSQKDQEHCTKYENNILFAMDYDSGYISHNPESNLDSSSEIITEILKEDSCSKPVYLSEDALLEKPEVRSAFFNLSMEIENEDYEETRKLFNSSDTENEILPESVESGEISYSGFDKDSSISDIEIPCADKITVDKFSLVNALNNNIDSRELVEEKASGKENDSCWRNDEGFKGFPMNQRQPISAFSNITNTLATSDPKKKLTLIFSKSDKENLYSVKRKYRSLSPGRGLTSEEQEGGCEDALQVLPDVPKDIAPDKLDDSDHKGGVSDMSIEDIPEDTKFIACKKEYPFSETFSRNFIFSPACEQSVTINDETEHVVPKTDEVTNIETKIVVNLPDSSEVSKHLDLNEDIEEEIISEQIECANDSKIGSEKTLPKPPETPEKKYQSSVKGSVTPDLFEDEAVEDKPRVSLPPVIVKEGKYIHKKDKTILRRVQNSLKGVIPPHSVTVVQISAEEILNKIEINKEYFWSGLAVEPNSDVVASELSQSMNNSGSSSDTSSLAGTSKSLLVSCALEDCIKKDFPEILKDRYHGLYHNCSKLSEEFEDLCTKYGQRYVGAETQSTCTVFESTCVSPTKRKQIKQRWAAKSPGRRLSHLARRRITFSSVNLQSGSSTFAGSRARQILVDTKNLDRLRRKSPRKTPKKTPSKSPRTKTRTPSSSAKKKLAIRFRKLTGEIEKTSTSADNTSMSSKRALFTSPNCDKKSSLFMPSTSGLSKFDHEVKKPSTKRALFMSPNRKSPLKCSPFKRSPFRRSPLKRSPFKRLELGVADKKRKRTDSEDARPSKLPKSQSTDVRPSTSEHKTTDRLRSDSSMSQNRNPVGELSAVHKKKLQWAVYEALRSQNVTPAHAQFKLFASILARLTRRFLPNLSANAPRPEGGTSERMLRIARHHVFSVIKGKSVDEIYNEYVKSRARQLKPQGYVSLEDFIGERRENKENAFEGKGSSQRRGAAGVSCASSENKIERIRKVINFGDDNR